MTDLSLRKSGSKDTEITEYRKIIDFIQFTQEVASKIYGIKEEDAIFRVLKECFEASRVYNMSVLMLTGDGTALKNRVFTSSASVTNIKFLEKQLQKSQDEYRIPLSKSPTYSRVAIQGETVYHRTRELMNELFPRIFVPIIVKIFKYEDEYGVITPIKRKGKIIGTFGMTAVDFTPDLMTSIKNLGIHISNALDICATQRELIDAKEKAEEADRIKSSFLASMSHEIRTPMNAVLGFIELVLSNKDIPVVERNHLEYAKKSSVSLLQLINEIMDFSKLEKDQFILEHIPFSLLDVLTKIHSTASVLLEHKKNRVGLNRILPANIPRYIYGDPRKLEQVLLNLLGNAIKFTSRGEISYGIHPRKKGYLTFFVRDTGTGILPEHRQHIFQPFRQADEKISRKHGGTGLGLAISKRIIELMGGSIWFESEPNEGTSFNFKIPCKPAKETDLNILMNEQQNTARISGKKILIIEDSRINRIYLEAILTKDGYQVVSAEDGLEGLEVLQRNGPFDLVLMDMYMPNLDGVEATKRIRNLNSSSGIPILGFTAAGTTKERELLKSAGCDDVINKPVQKEDLTAAISQLIFGN